MSITKCMIHCDTVYFKSFKRLEKLWASVQLDFKLEPDILAVVNKFMKKYLVGSAADSRAASGKAFPATQLASCCPPLCLKLQCQAIISQAAVVGKMVSYGVLMSEILGSKVSPQLCLDEDLQIAANIANFIFWTVVVNKSQTTISGVGRVSNGVVLDYLGTAECDSYGLYVENSILKMVSLQSFFEFYEAVADEKGLTYKDGGMTGLHPSKPFAKLPGILNIETGRLIHGPEILDWYYSYCWENDSKSFTYQVDMTEVMSGMMTAMVIANIPITIAVDSVGAKTPKGMNFLITYMEAVLGIKPTSKFKKQLEIDHGFSVAISEKKFELIYKNRHLDPGDENWNFPPKGGGGGGPGGGRGSGGKGGGKGAKGKSKAPSGKGKGKVPEPEGAPPSGKKGGKGKWKKEFQEEDPPIRKRKAADKDQNWDQSQWKEGSKKNWEDWNIPRKTSYTEYMEGDWASYNENTYDENAAWPDEEGYEEHHEEESYGVGYAA